jgi:hypothetical protein
MGNSSRIYVLNTAAYAYPLVTDIENLARSCFSKIEALFTKLEHFARLLRSVGQLVIQSTRHGGSAAFKRRIGCGG